MRALFVFASVLTAAALTGCSGAPAADDNASESELRHRPSANKIELGEAVGEDTLQAKLFHVLASSADDATLGITGESRGTKVTLRGDDDAARSVSCTVSTTDDSIEIVAPGGGGFQRLSTYSCTLEGFDVNRGGGSLPQVIPAEGQHPLAARLFSLLSSAADRGDLGVDKSVDDPGCCDRASTITTVLATPAGKLTCTDVAGGFVFIERFSCSYERAIAPNE